MRGRSDERRAGRTLVGGSAASQDAHDTLRSLGTGRLIRRQYQKKIEKLFKDDPELAKEFKDVAGLNAMKAAQKALEAFAKEKKDTRNDDERDAAYGRYTARLMKSQELSGTMTLNDGKLRSASVDFMEKAVGEIKAPEASTKAQQVTGQQISRSV
ncbi:MAG: hypothetical protein PGN25_14945 [Methylorubrum populi]